MTIQVPTQENFNHWIRYYRREFNITLIDMANDFGSNPATFREFETGGKNPSPRLLRLCQHYFQQLENEQVKPNDTESRLRNFASDYVDHREKEKDLMNDFFDILTQR